MSAYAVSRSEPPFPWWLVLLEGISLVFLGILLLISPGMTTVVLVQFLGIYWLIAGIFRIIGIFLDSPMWGWKLLSGALGIIAGIIVINHPVWSPLVLAGTVSILLGIQGIIMGAVSVFQAIKGAGWGMALLGAVSIIFGVILLVNAWAIALSLPLILGVLGIVGGLAAIAIAFRMK